MDFSNFFNNNHVSVKTRNGSVNVTGGNIKMQNGRIWVDGVEVTEVVFDGEVTALSNITHLTINGDVRGLAVDMVDNISITGNVNGKVESRNGNIACGGDVQGDVESRNGAITCGNIGGSVTSRNGNIKHTIAKDSATKPTNPVIPTGYMEHIEQEFLNGKSVVKYDGELGIWCDVQRGERLNWTKYFYTDIGCNQSKEADEFCTIKEE